jgi:hypothetical protein
MKLIQNFNLPPFTRTQFVSREAKEKWEVKIRNAQKVYNELETSSVEHGVRDAMLAFVSSDRLEFAMREFTKRGMMFVPARKEAYNGSFSHQSMTYSGGNMFTYRGVLTKRNDIAGEFIDALHNNNDIKIGQLLGFPECCCNFFDENWQNNYFDPMWQQAQNSGDAIKYEKEKDGKYIIRLKEDETFWHNTSVFRYVGVRTVPHIPCSVNCKGTKVMAVDWLNLANDLKLDGTDDIKEILSLPYSWDVYKGCAEVTTPVLKIRTKSVFATKSHIVQRESSYYPEESVTGLDFPFKNPLFS